MKNLFNAGRFLLEDLLSTIVFVVLFSLTKSLYLATGLAIAIGVGQVVLLKLRGRPVDAMQWLSLGLVVVMGGATLLTHDRHFIMVKPTIIYLAVGAVMLKPGWMNRYLPAIVQENAPDLGRLFGRVWAGLMFATAAANLVVAFALDAKAWAWFVAVIPLGSKIAVFLAQYAVTRLTVGSRLRASRAAATAVAA